MKEVVSQLLDHVADIEGRSKLGKTALIEAIEIYLSDVVEVSPESSPSPHSSGTELTQTSLHDDMIFIGTVRLLLDRGADIDAKLTDGTTALMNAADVTT